MTTTNYQPGSLTIVLGGNQRPPRNNDEQIAEYQRLLDEQRFGWTVHHRLIRLLGAGGQGVVYLSERRGADNFTLPVAIKVFSPERYESEHQYAEAMTRIAHVASRVAQIQQDNLIDVHNFVDRKRIRLLEMEWVDGYDLNRLLAHDVLVRVRNQVSNRRWEYLNNVIVTAGPRQSRLKPGIAVAVVRDCLAALAALHREGIVHGDIKPSNIMLKRAGNAKIIDIGAAFEMSEAPIRRTCTPAYAAPEVLEGGECTPRSDLASLGYVLIEMLSGVSLFSDHNAYRDLLEAKRSLPNRLHRILPPEVVSSELLMNFCRVLVAADPMRRFPNAEVADVVQEGAAGFHRQLVKSDLASEYENELRLWLEELE